MFLKDDEKESKCENEYINLKRKERNIIEELYNEYRSWQKFNKYGVAYEDYEDEDEIDEDEEEM